jgi:hypothetical protein
MPWASAISMPGTRREKTLAASITPAAKPSIPSRSLRLGSRARKTLAAPKAVRPQVKSPPKRA